MITGHQHTTASVTRTRPPACLLAVGVIIVLSAGAHSADDQNNDSDAVDLPMRLHPEVTLRCFADPNIKRPPKPTPQMTKEIRELWLSVLDSEEDDLVREAVLAMGETHREGYLDFSDAAAKLESLLERPGSSVTLLKDIARTLLIIDAKQSAPALMATLEKHPALAPVIEPALAHWKHEPIRAQWLARLREPAKSSRPQLILAIQGLAAARVAGAGPLLFEFVNDGEQNFRIRHESARALSSIGADALPEVAASLYERKAFRPRLLAAELLRIDDSESGRNLLLRMVNDQSPAVAGIAWERMRQLDSKSLIESARKTRLDGDDALRAHAVAVLIDHPNAEHIQLLGESLDDPHPRVRNAVRHGLLNLAGREDFGTPVLQAGVKALGQESWRSIEQAILLLTRLKHLQSRHRIGELMWHPRREVLSAAAWSLKEFNSRDMLPLMLRRAVETDDLMPQKENYFFQAQDIQTAHLFEAFAALDYREAEPLMRRYVPKGLEKRYDMTRARCAAIWTLGLFYAGRNDRSLARQFTGRMLDDGTPPEKFEVQAICAVSLGRLGANQHLRELRRARAVFGVRNLAGRRVSWALNQLTGEPMPELLPLRKSRGNWFLEPLPRRAADAD